MKDVSCSSFDEIFPTVKTLDLDGKTTIGLNQGRTLVPWGAVRFPTIISDYIMRQIYDNFSLCLTPD